MTGILVRGVEVWCVCCDECVCVRVTGLQVWVGVCCRHSGYHSNVLSLHTGHYAVEVCDGVRV